MPDVDAVLLDVGGVLLIPHPDSLAPTLAPFAARLTPASVHRGHYAGIAAMDALGRWAWDRYVAELVRYADVPPESRPAATAALAADFDTAVAWSLRIEESVAALAALHATGTMLAVVSNSDGGVGRLLARTGVCQEGPGVGVPVTTIVDSGVVGVAKPDPEIFRIALDRLGVPAHRAVHVGDTTLADVHGAQAAGVRALHLDPYGDCGYPPGHHEHVGALADVVGLLG